MGRNKELKSIVIKILIIAIVFIAVGSLVINIILESINIDIIERDFAIVGKLIEKYPDSETEIVSNITKDSSQEDVENGKKVLEKYGYTSDIKQNLQPLLNRNIKSIKIFFLSFIMVLILALLVIVYVEYKKIYKKVKKLSNVSEKVMEGDFSFYLEEAGEGDFNILNHHFNQMSGRLKNNLDILQSEKIYLKDTISNISHQLKTPLSSLIVLNDILISDREMTDLIRLDFLEKMSSQLTRIEWLILNLLKMARIEAGSIDFKKETVYLKDIVDTSLSALRPLMENTSVEVRGNINSKFMGDSDWTAEALINIIKNAVEHGGGKIFIDLEESPLFTSIKISDKGEGIDKKEIVNIFKRFYKGESSVKPDSIGIGLNLSKLIVESQEGVISVTSKKGIGTEFTIRFLKKKLDKDIVKM